MNLGSKTAVNGAGWDWLTVGQAATLLGVEEGTIRRLLNKKVVPGVYLGTRAGWRVRRDTIERWMLEQEREQTQ